jgi:catechol 2,3-dioxygenase-like lactoylglutathione lyase family enzyme
VPDVNGFSHLALSVSDIERSKEWYSDVLGWQVAMEQPGLVIFMHPSGLLLGLRQHEGMSSDAYTHLNCGMDHAGFAVDSREDLEKWQAHFDEKGVKHSGIEESPVGIHLNFRDPDNIPLELFLLTMGG